MSNPLTELKNIGNTSALWLHAVGIFNHEQLKNIGAVDAYVRIQERGIKTSKVLLYALYGALTDEHWNDISPEIKQQLCERAEARITSLHEN